ncbi:MAG: hypothetical protein H3C57_03030 [Gammaproteobacteria bacterium]|nr:hypothetical protein [Gammaproteobacteria bacterium]
MQAERANTHRWILASMEETRAAAIAIAATAKRSLAILTPDLEPDVYEHENFLDVAKRLVLARPYARIQVLVSEPARAIRNGNRFVGVARRLNSRIELRNIPEQHRGIREAFLIADDSALLYRVDASRWEGIADSCDPLVTQRYRELFDSLWELSGPEAEAHALQA